MGLRVMSGDDLPDVIELEAALLGVARTCLDLHPISAEILTDADGSTVNEMGRAREQPVRATPVTAHPAQAINLPAVEVWSRHLPIPSLGVCMKEKCASGCAYQHSYPSSAARIVRVSCHVWLPPFPH